MNPQQTNPPPIPTTSSSFIRVAQELWTQLVRHNPLYILSADCLLYGVNQVSSEPHFAGAESSQVSFNFSALLIYELLLVFTALFLARRKIWHDSLVLVVLENLFVMVPFSLISRAVFLNSHGAWAMCGIAFGFGIGKLIALRHSIPMLNFTRRLLVFGAVMLALNAALPLVSRHFAENPNALNLLFRSCWIAIIPATTTLIRCLPTSDDRNASAARKYGAHAFFGLWFIVTIFHVGATGYVHTFTWGIALLTPSIWCLAWLLFEHMQQRQTTISRWAIGAPTAATILAIGYHHNILFWVLTSVNALLYAFTFIRTKNVLIRNFAIACGFGVMAAFPEPWGRLLVSDFSRGSAVAGTVGLFVLLYCAVSKDPRLAVFGAISAGTLTAALVPEGYGGFVGMQVAFVVFLLHSLRWQDDQHKGAKAVRLVICGLWCFCSLLMALASSAGLMVVSAFAAAILGTTLVSVIIFKNRRARVIFGAATIILCSNALTGLQVPRYEIPSQCWPIFLGFILFAIGTVTALRKGHSKQ